MGITAWWQLAILIIVGVLGFGGVSAIVTRFFKNVKGGSVSIGAKGITMSEDGGKGDKKKKKFEAHCPRAVEALNLIHEQNAYLDFKWHTKEVTIIKEQMRVYEREEPAIRALVWSAYLKELRGNGSIDGLIESDVAKLYKKDLTIMLSMVKVQVRDMCRQNHFAEKSRAEWKDYKDTQGKNIVAIGTEYLDNNYVGTEVSRERVFTVNKEVIQKNGIMQIVSDALDEMREVAIEHTELIETKKTTWEGHVAKYFAGTGVLSNGERPV